MFVLLPSLLAKPAVSRGNQPSSFPKLRFPRIRTPLSRIIPDEDFSALFKSEPEYKFDSFLIDCFICQNKADKDEDVKPSDEDIEDLEISDSHELNGNVGQVDDDESEITDVSVLRVSEENATGEEEVENSTEVLY